MIVDRLFYAGDADDRAADSDFWFRPIGYSTAAGWISPEKAMRASAVFACVRVISETLGSLPCITYRRLERGKERATAHPLYQLLRWKPNAFQTAIEFFETMTAICALRGNAFGEKLYSGRGELTGILPFHPDRLQVDEGDDGRLKFLYRDPRSGVTYRYLEDEVFHLRGLSLGSRLGFSPIGYAAQTIGTALAVDEFSARFFENDATPPGLLTHPQHFRDKETREAFRKAWQQAQSGANRGKTAVLEDGMKYEKIGMTNADAQFLESKKYGVVDIARLFRVPLVLLGETEKSTSWGSGIEQFMIAFVVHTIRPWCTRWEQALRRDFFDDPSPDDEYFAEFLVDALQRGDQASRYGAYSRGIQDGWLTRNEAREKENLNPLPGLDEPLEPLNMARASEPRDGAAHKPGQARDADDEEA